MNKLLTSTGIAIRMWFYTSLLFAAGLMSWLFIQPRVEIFFIGIVSFICSALGSTPALIVMAICIPLIRNSSAGWPAKFRRLLLLQIIITGCYGLVAAAVNFPTGLFFERRVPFLSSGALAFVVLTAASTGSSFILLRAISCFFSDGETAFLSYNETFISIFKYSQKIKDMESFDQPQQQHSNGSNRVLIKGLITGGLILLMLIPTIFINNLILERAARQKEAVADVSSKWATAQTLSGPFIVLPYIDSVNNDEDKAIASKTKIILFSSDMNVNGNIFPEERSRSIYKVLLYKSDLNISGTFKPQWPTDINISNLDFSNARLCFGLTDLKGIEEDIYINFNNQKLLLRPGLPVHDLGDIGLSVPVSINPDMIKTGITFNMQVKIKGSEQLHFIPLGTGGNFYLASSWRSPSFDGNSLPNERQISEKGFSARWKFNQANLPFGSVVKQGSISNKSLAFGVSMVQPADQYNKTMRSVKYAILFIGLTFSLFFIIELMQRKPFHPVQYVLVGLALVIFYTLLLAISEYILFDYAYLVAAAATILLITVYAKGHFKSWKTAGIFCTVLSCLYGFIFVLISLEDTALLVGSIGLFAVLAIIMYVSRKINWYGETLVAGNV